MSFAWFTDRRDDLRRWASEHQDFVIWFDACAELSDDRGMVGVEFLASMDADRFPDGQNDCLNAAAKALEILATGHETYVRAGPKMRPDLDFCENKKFWRSYVRFMVGPKEGAWAYSRPMDGEAGYLGL